MLGRWFEREAVVRDLFGQYVMPELAEAAIEHRGRLGGQLVTSTVLFCDIRDFTGIGESPPQGRARPRHGPGNPVSGGART